jgi:AAA15 family ATPase/GTPase
MLLRLRFTNFRSFHREQELSFIPATALKDHQDSLIYLPALKQFVLPSAAIYGANASGKTNLIRALLFFTKAVIASHKGWEPDQPIKFEPFAGGVDQAKQSALYEMDFLINGIRHCYGFRLNSTSILEEWLYAYPSGKKQSWFHRKQGEPIQFGKKLPGPNRAIEKLTRKNSLYLSAAAQNNHEALTPAFNWLSSIRFVADAMANRSVFYEFTAQLCKDSSFAETVARLVRAADLGIEGLEVEKRKISEKDQRVRLALASALDVKANEVHLGPEHSIRLIHRIGSKRIAFDSSEESDGTLAYLRVLAPAVKALEQGGLFCVDELDSSLHPVLAAQLVGMFNNNSANSKGAQLIFNTHDATLLSSANLRRDQIWFVEKGDDGSSQLYPLTDFKPRLNENLENGYLHGRYGAVPFVDLNAFPRRIQPK